MTDKQIIIDGVDVSGCPYYRGHDICKNTCHYFSTPCKWVDVQNCTYKQFKQAEQTVGECHKYQAVLEDKLQAKEQECEELKEKVKKYGEINEQETKDYAELKNKTEKYKQTLTEIKEVLQFYNNTTIGIDKGNGIFEFEVSNDNVLGGKLICCYDTNPAKKALKKISEVEDES